MLGVEGILLFCQVSDLITLSCKYVIIHSYILIFCLFVFETLSVGASGQNSFDFRKINIVSGLRDRREGRLQRDQREKSVVSPSDRIWRAEKDLHPTTRRDEQQGGGWGAKEPVIARTGVRQGAPGSWRR